MARALGIDLGTTNSCVSVLEGGEPTVIANSEGSRTTPSVVGFSKNGEVLVGEVAKRQAVTNVDRTISSVKRHMGTDWKVDIDGTVYTPQQISAFILQKLKKDAEAYLGEPVTDAVITVPAYFNDAQRQATKDAGQIAGLNVQRIVNEPTAAALAYGLEKGKEDELILVFDLGGGTFDVSLLEVGKDDDGFSTIQVRATSGDNKLGGDDWDERIVNWLVEQVKASSGADLSKDKIALQRLKEAAEKAKKELSSTTSTNVSLPYISMSESGPIHVDETLTRAKFEEMTKDLLERTKEPFRNVVRDAGIKVSDIDHVVLVGGSTRMPAVTNVVKELTGGKEPNKGVNPDEVVAVGAALQAGVISGDRKDVLLIDVTPLSLGIETSLGGTSGIMTKLIELHQQSIKDSTPPEVSQMLSELKAPRRGKRKKASHGVLVEGEGGYLVRLARCCNPIPGDPITGYITRGRGVSVHRSDCPNVLNDTEFTRVIEVSWDIGLDKEYTVGIEIICNDRNGMLSEILAVPAEMKVNIHTVNATPNRRNKTSTVLLGLNVSNIDQITQVMTRVRLLKDVYRVTRTLGSAGIPGGDA